MDDAALDWRPVVDRLARGWPTIAAVALAAGALAFAWRALDPARYAATVVLTVGRPDARLDVDPRFEASQPNAAFPYRVASLRAYPELVLADGIAEAVRQTLEAGAAGDPAAPRVDDLVDLRRRVEARAVADGALIAIQARAETPEAAARMANTWAEVFIERMHAVLGPDASAGASPASSSTRPELRVASPAVPVRKVDWSAWLRDALAAGVLGAILGAAWVLVRRTA